MESFWTVHSGEQLAQGDLLADCLIPRFDPSFGEGSVNHVPVQSGNMIIVTQSCDLANNKSQFVALCPVFALSEFEAIAPVFQRKGAWEEVRRGRREGLHLLSSPTAPEDNRQALVVDFREIYSLPFEYLVGHASELGARPRLCSPYLEHFSQALARFFMRVGLPSTIPPYK